MIVYLCGPINGRSDDDCTEWREQAKLLLGADNCLDPTRRDYRGREHEATAEIVELDKKDMDASNVLLVYFDKPSVGTAMEVLYAWERHIPIVVVDVSDKSLSPWLTYHSTHIVRSVADAAAWIETL